MPGKKQEPKTYAPLNDDELRALRRLLRRVTGKSSNVFRTSKEAGWSDLTQLVPMAALEQVVATLEKARKPYTVLRVDRSDAEGRALYKVLTRTGSQQPLSKDETSDRETVKRWLKEADRDTQSRVDKANREALRKKGGNSCKVA